MDAGAERFCLRLHEGGTRGDWLSGNRQAPRLPHPPCSLAREALRFAQLPSFMPDDFCWSYIVVTPMADYG